jgi:hypothetical protein
MVVVVIAGAAVEVFIVIASELAAGVVTVQ